MVTTTMRPEQLSYHEMVLDNSGLIMTKETKMRLRQQHGFCMTCPGEPVLLVEMHRSKMNPLWLTKKLRTVENEVYQGKCLRCNPGAAPLGGGSSHNNNSNRNSLSSSGSFHDKRSHHSGRSSGRRTSLDHMSSGFNSERSSRSSVQLDQHRSTSERSGPRSSVPLDAGDLSSRGERSSGGRRRRSRDGRSLETSGSFHSGGGGGSSCEFDVSDNASRRNRARSKSRPKSVRDKVEAEIIAAATATASCPLTPGRRATPRSLREVRSSSGGPGGSERELVKVRLKRVPTDRSQQSSLSSGDMANAAAAAAASYEYGAAVAPPPALKRVQSDRAHDYATPMLSRVQSDMPAHEYTGPTIMKRVQSDVHHDHYAPPLTPRVRRTTSLSGIEESDFPDSPCKTPKTQRKRSTSGGRPSTPVTESMRSDTTTAECYDDLDGSFSCEDGDIATGLATIETSSSHNGQHHHHNHHNPSFTRNLPRRVMSEDEKTRGLGGGSGHAPVDRVVKRHPTSVSPTREQQQQQQQQQGGGGGMGGSNHDAVHDLRSLVEGMKGSGDIGFVTEILLNSMEVHGSSIGVQLYALNAMADMYGRQEGGVAASEALVERILRPMTSFTTSAGIQTSGCRVIAVLASNAASNGSVLAGTDACEFVVASLSRHCGDPSVVAAALDALQKLTLSPEARNALVENVDDLTGKVSDAVGCHVHDPHILKSGCAFFNNMLGDDSSMRQLRSNDTVADILRQASSIGCTDADAIIIKIEQSKADDEFVEEQALENILALAVIRQNDNDVVADVIDVMKTFEWSSKVNAGCIIALKSLAKSSEYHKDKIRQDSSRLLGQIQRHYNDETVLSEARSLMTILDEPASAAPADTPSGAFDGGDNSGVVRSAVSKIEKTKKSSSFEEASESQRQRTIPVPLSPASPSSDDTPEGRVKSSSSSKKDKKEKKDKKDRKEKKDKKTKVDKDGKVKKKVKKEKSTIAASSSSSSEADEKKRVKASSKSPPKAPKMPAAAAMRYGNGGEDNSSVVSSDDEGSSASSKDSGKAAKENKKGGSSRTSRRGSGGTRPPAAICVQ